MSADRSEDGGEKDVRELLDALSKLAVLQNIKGLQLLWWYTMDVKHLYSGPRESTLGCLGISLHKENHRRGRDSLLNLVAGLLGDVTPCEGKGRRCQC